MTSFNIRNFGKLMKGTSKKRSQGSWDLLVRYCERCDFIAIQEVLDDLSSLFHLRERLGDKYSLVFSDAAGAVPSRRGRRERLAFLYRNDRITHTELASDISFERSAILDTLYEDRALFAKSFEQRTKDLEEWEAKVAAASAAGRSKPDKQPFVLPKFVLQSDRKFDLAEH